MSMLDDLYSTLFPDPVIPPSDTPIIDHPVGTESTHEQSLTQPTPGVHEGFLSPDQHDAIHQALTMALGIGDGGIGGVGKGKLPSPFEAPAMTHELTSPSWGGFPRWPGAPSLGIDGPPAWPYNQDGLNLVRAVTKPKLDADGNPWVKVAPAGAYAGGWMDPDAVRMLGAPDLHTGAYPPESDFGGRFVRAEFLKALPQPGGLPSLDAHWTPYKGEMPSVADMPADASDRDRLIAVRAGAQNSNAERGQTPDLQKELEAISPQFSEDRPVDMHIVPPDPFLAAIGRSPAPMTRVIRRDDLLDVRGGREGTRPVGGMWVLPQSLTPVTKP